MYHINVCPIFFFIAQHMNSPTSVAAVCCTLCTVAAQRNDYWSGSATGKWTPEGQWSTLVPLARDEGVDGISPMSCLALVRLPAM